MLAEEKRLILGCRQISSGTTVAGVRATAPPHQPEAPLLPKPSQVPAELERNCREAPASFGRQAVFRRGKLPTARMSGQSRRRKGNNVTFLPLTLFLAAAQGGTSLTPGNLIPHNHRHIV